MQVLLMTGLLAAAAGTLPADTDFHLEHRSRCVRSMGLSAEEVAKGLHEYRLVRCIEESVARELQSERIRRAEERLNRMQSEFRGRIREGKRFLSPVTRQRFDPDAPTPRAFSQRALRRSLQNNSTEEARKEQSLLRQARMTQAREACRNVPRSFYQNCVRETIRTLGESN